MYIIHIISNQILLEVHITLFGIRLIFSQAHCLSFKINDFCVNAYRFVQIISCVADGVCSRRSPHQRQDWRWWSHRILTILARSREQNIAAVIDININFTRDWGKEHLQRVTDYIVLLGMCVVCEWANDMVGWVYRWNLIFEVHVGLIYVWYVEPLWASKMGSWK